MNPLAQGIVLHPDHWSRMEADVRLRASEEACGIVAGQGNRCRLVIPITNILHSPSAFRMDPQEELDAFLQAEGNGWEVLAIYHSHPHGISQPSVTDHAELTFPGIVYIIWYNMEGEWRCRGFLMDAGHQAGEVPVIVTAKE